MTRARTCPVCKEDKPANHDFFVFRRCNVDNGFMGECKSCKSKADREYRLRNANKLREKSQKRRIENKEVIREKKRQEYIKDRDRLLKKQALWRLNNLERNRQNARDSYLRRKDDVIARQVKKRAADPKLRLNHSFSSRMRFSLRDGKNGRSWEKLVGYTLDELIYHLESLFRNDMTWDNYGCGGWHVDHIKPVSKFFYETANDPQFKECWALKNLQPLWESENWIKNDTWPMEKYSKPTKTN